MGRRKRAKWKNKRQWRVASNRPNQKWSSGSCEFQGIFYLCWGRRWVGELELYSVTSKYEWFIMRCIIYSAGYVTFLCHTLRLWEGEGVGRLKIRGTVVSEETILCRLPRILYLLFLKLCFSTQGLVPIPCKAQAFYTRSYEKVMFPGNSSFWS